MAELHHGDRPEPDEPDKGGGADRPPRFSPGEPPDWNAPRWQHAKFELSPDDEATLAKASALSSRDQGGMPSREVERDDDEVEDRATVDRPVADANDSAADEPEPANHHDASNNAEPPVDRDAREGDATPAQPEPAEQPAEAGDHSPHRTILVRGEQVNAYLDPDAAAGREAATRMPDPLPEERTGERIAEADDASTSRMDRVMSGAMRKADGIGDVSHTMSDSVQTDVRPPERPGPGLLGRTGQIPGPAVHDQPLPAVQTDSLVSASLVTAATAIGVWSLASRVLHWRHNRGSH